MINMPKTFACLSKLYVHKYVCMCVIVRRWAIGGTLSENGRNKRRYRLAAITGGELVKRLETCVGGNVKVSEWPIQCAVASGQTGPRSLAVFIWHARHSRAERDETGYATTRNNGETDNGNRRDGERQENETRKLCLYIYIYTHTHIDEKPTETYKWQRKRERVNE